MLPLAGCVVRKGPGTLEALVEKLLSGSLCCSAPYPRRLGVLGC